MRVGAVGPQPTVATLEKRYGQRRCPIRAARTYRGRIIKSLGQFLEVCSSLLDPSNVFWFRGHSRAEFALKPGALRYPDAAKRARALGIVAEMRRCLEIELERPPDADDGLGWMQVAQHYGLPTRLLDWTENAGVALYFACCEYPKADGLVAVMNPRELNQLAIGGPPRLLDPRKDEAIIRPYLDLGGHLDRIAGKPTVAISPVWNTPRIAAQKGTFTLHGSRSFALDSKQVSSLMYVPVLREYKAKLLVDLERMGIGEMDVYPEPEHICRHLRRAAGL